MGYTSIVPNNNNCQGVDLLIPASTLPDPPGYSVPPFTALPDRRYLISTPLETVSTDLNTSSLGQQLGNNKYGDTWCIDKWMWDTEGYHTYNGADAIYDELMSLKPGKGFWLQQTSNSPITITLEGTKVNPTDGYYEIGLPKNSLDVIRTYHMIGNPYWYPIRWGDFKVRIPMTETLPTAKATTAEEEVESWYVGVKLSAAEGTIRDTYNRAGVVTKGDDAYLDAFDMAPMGDYIRLMFVDGVQQLAYDFRPGGLSEYIWNIELSTSYDFINASLSLDNIMNVPEGYEIILNNDETDESYQITEDYSLPVTLTKGAVYNFTLTALPPSSAVEQAEIPRVFGIQATMPNPFNPTTIIQYALTMDSDVKIHIYNVNGQQVDILVNNRMNAGVHSVVWNARGHASGMYFIALEANNQRDVTKVILVK